MFLKLEAFVDAYHYTRERKIMTIIINKQHIVSVVEDVISLVNGEKFTLTSNGINELKEDLNEINK